MLYSFFASTVISCRRDICHRILALRDGNSIRPVTDCEGVLNQRSKDKENANHHPYTQGVDVGDIKCILILLCNQRQESCDAKGNPCRMGCCRNPEAREGQNHDNKTWDVFADQEVAYISNESEVSSKT